MIKHEMKITVRNSSGQSLDIAEFKKLSLFKRLSTKWFGKVQKVMVIVLGGQRTVSRNQRGGGKRW